MFCLYLQFVAITICKVNTDPFAYVILLRCKTSMNFTSSRCFSFRLFLSLCASLLDVPSFCLRFFKADLLLTLTKVEFILLSFVVRWLDWIWLLTLHFSASSYDLFNAYLHFLKLTNTFTIFLNLHVWCGSDFASDTTLK